MLYFIPTPIWNKEDITLRALRLFKEVQIFICEDTRTAKKLLSMYNISLEEKMFYSLTSFTSKWKLEYYRNILKENNAIMISEAGSPWLSDPWKSLVQVCNENEISYSVLPGANALIPSVVAAGFDTTEFQFIWFLPSKKWRKSTLANIVNCDIPTFFYESVHRMIKLLEELSELKFSWKIFIARELSKLHEQYFTWDLKECESLIKSGNIQIKGEFVVGLKK